MRNWFKWIWSRLKPATKQDLDEMVEEIMAKIQESTDKLSAAEDRIELALSGVTTDIADLKVLIEELRVSSEVPPADQFLLDQVVARAESIATRLEALDEATPTP